MILREVKQQLPNETKEKGNCDELLRSLHNQISSLETETGFLREEVKEKNNVITTPLRRNSCKCKVSSSCESSKLDNISEKNEERHNICMSATSNPIQSYNERQFTKLAKKKSRVKDVQIDSIIQAHPDERTHLTNTEVKSSNITEMSHVMNKENEPLDKKEINHHYHLKTQLAPKNLKH